MVSVVSEVVSSVVSVVSSAVSSTAGAGHGLGNIGDGVPQNPPKASVILDFYN